MRWTGFLSIAVAGVLFGCRDIEAPTPMNAPRTASTELDDEEGETCPYSWHTEEECNNIRAMTTQETADVQFMINHILTYDSECQALKESLQSKLNAGEIKAYTAVVQRADGEYHTRDGAIHLFEPRGRGASELGWTVLHEGAHAIGVNAETGAGSAEWYSNYCWLGD